jgi:hypothetical protein
LIGGAARGSSAFIGGLLYVLRPRFSRSRRFAFSM